MFAESTTYRSGSRIVEVLPGESHSAAWLYITSRGPLPERYPCRRTAAGGLVRRRDHASRRTHPRRRRVLTGVT
jgi:hypothetical protein